jgi:hypothetical protein
MVDFMINVPKNWTEELKEELKVRIEKANIFAPEDVIFITNQYTVHQVDTKTYDMLQEMKDKLDQ